MDNVTPLALVDNPVLIFFLVLAIILLTPMLVRRLHIPHVVGLIIAGVIIGPHGLNILNYDSSFEIFGQVGLLYLMFLVGLEIDMFHLRLNIKKGLVFSALTFLIPFVAGILSSVWLLNISWEASILMAAMYAAHTLIAYPIISRYELIKRPVVLISIVGTIFAILGSLIALAIGTGIVRDGGLRITYIVRLFIYIIIWGAGILYAYPRLTRWFFKTVSDGISQFLFILALVFLAAWTAQVIGLESVLGAFFAGIVLNRYIPIVSSLMGRLEFVGNTLFIPYFLLGVGMIINIHVITNLHTLWVALNMIIVALATKWVAAFLAQKAYRMNSDERNLMFGLSSAHTAVAIAVAMIGYNVILPDGSHLISESIMNGTILMILVTCTIAPIVTERAASRERTRLISLGELNNSRREKQTGLVQTLVSASNPLTVKSLIDLANMMRNKNLDEKLYLLHIRSNDSKIAEMEAENVLRVAAKHCSEVNLEASVINRFDFNVASGIISSIYERGANQLMLGMHHRTSIADTFFGSIIGKILDATNRMIVISRCFIPLNTVTRILVYVPENAEFETGFSFMISRFGNLAHHLGCRIIFHAVSASQQVIRETLRESGFDIRSEYITVETWEDYMLLTRELLDDDLLIMVGARQKSVSYAKGMEDMPAMLSKYFSYNNILLVYPEQFGDTTQQPSVINPIL